MPQRPQALGHPLYEVHWVWGAPSGEAKRQAMREICRFDDPPSYYFNSRSGSGSGSVPGSGQGGGVDAAAGSGAPAGGMVAAVAVEEEGTAAGGAVWPLLLSMDVEVPQVGGRDSVVQPPGTQQRARPDD